LVGNVYAVQSPSCLTLCTKFLRPLTVNKLQKHFKLKKKCVPQYLIQTAHQVSVFQLHSTTTYGAHHKKHVTKCKRSVTSSKLFCQQMHSLLKHKMLHLKYLFIWLLHVSVHSDHHQLAYVGTLIKLQSL
jgi:hypothetical protein